MGWGQIETPAESHPMRLLAARLAVKQAAASALAAFDEARNADEWPEDWGSAIVRRLEEPMGRLRSALDALTLEEDRRLNAGPAGFLGC